MQSESIAPQAARVLQTLRERLELAGLQVEDTEGALLISDRAAPARISLCIESSQELWLRAELGVLPEQAGSLWCARLLAANLFSERAGGGAFALHEKRRIRLQRRVGLLEGVDYNTLADVVSRFVAGAAGFWSIVEPDRAAESAP